MNRTMLAIFLAGFAATGQAVTTGVLAPNGSPNAAAQRDAKPEAAKAMADDSSGMRKGTIEAVDIARGTFHVYGQTLDFDAAKVKIFDRAGKPTSTYALRRGTKVRFTLDPTDTTHRRVAVVYLD